MVNVKSSLLLAAFFFLLLLFFEHPPDTKQNGMDSMLLAVQPHSRAVGNLRRVQDMNVRRQQNRFQKITLQSAFRTLLEMS